MKVTNDVLQAVNKALSEVDKLLPMRYSQFEPIMVGKLKESLSSFGENVIERVYFVTPPEALDFDEARVSGLRVKVFNEKMWFKVYCKKGGDALLFHVVIVPTVMHLYKYMLVGESPNLREEVTEEIIVPTIHGYWVEEVE